MAENMAQPHISAIPASPPSSMTNNPERMPRDTNNKRRTQKHRNNYQSARKERDLVKKTWRHKVLGVH
jgi:hypothetical protein